MLTSAKIKFMKNLTAFLVLLFLLTVQSSFSQFCNDPEAWNYSPNGDTDTTCIYLLNCGENEVNRLFALFPVPDLNGAEIYLISRDEQDTLVQMVAVVEQNLPWDTNIMIACMHVDSCYYMDVYPAIDSVYMGPTFIRHYPDSWEYQGSFSTSISNDPNYFRIPVGAEQFTCGVFGCTDPAAINYDPMATLNVGCEYCEENEIMVTPTFVFSNQSASWKIQQNGENIAQDIFDSQGYNSFDIACLPDGCYELVLTGNAWLFTSVTLMYDTDTILTASLTQDGEVRAPFGINSEPCFEPGEIYGCTNPFGQNYNPQATIDDGSCDLQNDECNLGVEMYQDSITGNMHFDVDIFSTDYPIDIFRDFGDGSSIISDWWTQHTYDSAGTYQVCATLYTQDFFEYQPVCYDETCITIDTDVFGLSGPFQIILNDFDTGIQTISKLGELKLSPNPTTERIRFTLPKNQSPRNVRIHNIDGKLVLSLSDLKANLEQNEINVAQLATGTYLIFVEASDGSQYSARFVKL